MRHNSQTRKGVVNLQLGGANCSFAACCCLRFATTHSESDVRLSKLRSRKNIALLCKSQAGKNNKVSHPSSSNAWVLQAVRLPAGHPQALQNYQPFQPTPLKSDCNEEYKDPLSTHDSFMLVLCQQI